MCRFLIAKFVEPRKPESLLSIFAAMCERSKAPDGDWQGDGWGAAWMSDQGWETKKSLVPIWEDQEGFTGIPATRLFAVHARSAGFPQHKGILDHNQPYVGDGMCFVFNGMLRGVSLPMKLDGDIGAQKIFSFLRAETTHTSGDDALRTLDRTLLAHARRIDGMNVGLIKDSALLALCEYADNEEYFGLRYYQDSDAAMVCSAPLPGHEWRTMQKGEVLSL